MSENNETVFLSKAEIEMRQFRERVSSLLAGLIVMVALIVLLVAMIVGLRDESPGQAFTNLKDVLGFLNPLLGVILGYYFNKVSSENRAENAEKTARIAAATAQEAEEARQAMWQQNQAIRQQLGLMREFMGELTAAASQMLDHAPDVAANGAISFSVGTDTEAPIEQEQVLRELWRAVENAKKWGMAEGQP
jgi:hypothetical protein